MRNPALRSLGTCAVAGLCSPAMAQVEGEATWLWSVTTQDGDAIVEPGETAMVTLAIDMEPDTDPDGPVLGLAGVIFDTLGGANAMKGQVSGWVFHNDLDFVVGDTTTTDGVSLFGSTAAQLPLLDLVHFDPIDVITFEWSPIEAGTYTVDYATVTASWETMNPGFASIYVGDDRNFENVDWPIAEAAITFDVVPAPGVAPGALALALVAGAARRRAPAAP